MDARQPMQERVLEAAPTSTDGLRSGEVTAVSDDGALLDVRLSGRVVVATTAVGCLVRPIVGDRVLVFADGRDHFVLSVLERVGPNYATIALPGRGSLAIEAENVAVNARQRLSLKADAFDVKARAIAYVADKSTWLSKRLSLIAERLQASAATHETSADLIVSKSLDRIAVVDRADSLTAATRSVAVSGVATETAGSKVVTVAEDLRMDGKRVTVG